MAFINTNTKKFKAKFDKWLHQSVTNYDEEQLPTVEQAAEHLRERFFEEYIKGNKQVNRKPLQESFTDYLQGLPSAIDMPYAYHEIPDFAVSIGSLSPDYTEKEAERVTQNYWQFMSAKIMQSCERNGYPFSDLLNRPQ